MRLDEEMSGKQLAEILTFLAGQVQEGVDQGTDVVSQLRHIVEVLEEKHGSG